jgi:hypothetical protein
MTPSFIFCDEKGTSGVRPSACLAKFKAGVPRQPPRCGCGDRFARHDIELIEPNLFWAICGQDWIDPPRWSGARP